MGLLYIIISLLLNDEACSAFELKQSPNPSAWERALQLCNSSRSNLTFAVPAVNLTTMTVRDQIALEGDAWVGYFQSYEHFRFIGCADKIVTDPILSAQFSIGRNKNRPGLCYSHCGLQGYIGLQGNLCYCIGSNSCSDPDTLRFNGTCEKPLHCANEMLCGDQGGVNSNIAVYKKFSIAAAHDITGNDTGCLTVTKDKEYKMAHVNCTSMYRHLCETQNGSNLYLEESPEKQQWVHSIKGCGKPGKRPTTFIGDATPFTFPNSSGPWWVTVVRDLVIRNISESYTITPVYEGFLQKRDGILKLEFVHARNKSMKKSALCMSGEKMENTTLENKDTAPEISSSDPAKTMITTTTSESTMTSLISATTKSNQNVGKEVKENEQTLLTVVLPAGSATLGSIALITALILICRRRRLQKENIHNEAMKQQTTETGIPCNAEGHQTYHEYGKEILNQNGAKSRGDISSKCDLLQDNTISPSGTENLYDTANINIGDRTYDVTFTATNQRQIVQVNIYDHMSLKETQDGGYDHVSLQDQRKKVHDINIYDEANALALDNTDDETFPEKFKLRQQFEVNTYDTANFCPPN